MFDTKSDFALNKFDRDAIVCRSVTGVHIRLTRADFASEEEFLRWKVWSDGDYYDTEKDGRGFYDYCLSLSEAGTTGISTEDIFFTLLLKAEQEQQRAVLLQQIKGVLTETQYRRMWMYCVQRMTLDQIAQREGITHQSVSECLTAAQNRIVNKV